MMGSLLTASLVLMVIFPLASAGGYGHKGKLGAVGGGWGSSSSSGHGGSLGGLGSSSSSSGGSLLSSPIHGGGKHHLHYPKKQAKFITPFGSPPLGKFGGLIGGPGRVKGIYGGGHPTFHLASPSNLVYNKLRVPFRKPKILYGDWNPMPGGCCAQGKWLPIAAKGDGYGKGKSKSIIINVSGQKSGYDVKKNVNEHSSVESEPSVKSESSVNIGEASVSSGEYNVDDSDEVDISLKLNVQDEVKLEKQEPVVVPAPVPVYTPKERPAVYLPPQPTYTPRPPPTYTPRPPPPPTYTPRPPPPPTYTPRPPPVYSPRPPPTYTPRPQPSYAPRPQPTYAPRPQPTYAPRPQPTYAPRPQPTYTPRPPPRYTPRPPPPYLKQVQYQAPPKVVYEPRPSYVPPQPSPRPVTYVEVQPESESREPCDDSEEHGHSVEYTSPAPPVTKVVYDIPRPNYVEVVEYQSQKPQRVEVIDYKALEQPQQQLEYSQAPRPQQRPRYQANQAVQISSQVFGGASIGSSYREEERARPVVEQSYRENSQSYNYRPAGVTNEVQFWGLSGSKGEQVRDEEEVVLEQPEEEDEDDERERENYLQTVEQDDEERPVQYQQPITYHQQSQGHHVSQHQQTRYFPQSEQQQSDEVQVYGAYRPGTQEVYSSVDSDENRPRPPPRGPALVVVEEQREYRPQPRPQYIPPRPQERPQQLEQEEPEQEEEVQVVQEPPRRPRPVITLDGPEDLGPIGSEEGANRYRQVTSWPARPVQTGSEERHPIGIVHYRDRESEERQIQQPQVYEEQRVSIQAATPATELWVSPSPSPVSYTGSRGNTQEYRSSTYSSTSREEGISQGSVYEQPRPRPTYSPVITFSTTARPLASSEYSVTPSGIYRDQVRVYNNGEFGLKVRPDNDAVGTTTARPQELEQIVIKSNIEETGNGEAQGAGVLTLVEAEEAPQAREQDGPEGELSGGLLPQAVVPQQPVSTGYINRFPEAAAPEDFPVDSSEQGIIENNIVELRKVEKK